MRLTNLTSSSLFVAIFLTLGLTPKVQAQELPIQSDQLAPSAVQPADDVANALGQDLDTTLEENPSFAEKASSPFATEFFTRLDNLIQNAGQANRTPDGGAEPTPNTVNGIRGALEMNTLNNEVGNSPVPAGGNSVAPEATAPAPNNTVPSEVPVSGTAPTPTNTNPTVNVVPQTIPVPNIPTGNLGQ